MGMVAQVVGSLLTTFLGNRMSKSQSVPQVTTKASDLVPSTTSDTPEEPALGASSFDKTNKVKGRKSLMIDRTQDSKAYNPTNY